MAMLLHFIVNRLYKILQLITRVLLDTSVYQDLLLGRQNLYYISLQAEYGQPNCVYSVLWVANYELLRTTALNFVSLLYFTLSMAPQLLNYEINKASKFVILIHATISYYKNTIKSRQKFHLHVVICFIELLPSC